MRKPQLDVPSLQSKEGHPPKQHGGVGRQQQHAEAMCLVVVVVVYSGMRLGLPIAMHTEIIKRNTQCIYR